MDTAEQLILQKILSAMDTYQASDLHLSVGNPPMMRVRGRLVAMPDQQLLTPAFIENVALLWLDAYYAELLKQRKDVVCARTFENKRRFKIAAYYQQNHVTVTLSLIPVSVPPLQNTGLPPLAQRLALLDRGLVIIMGPFGSHMQLTAASFIEYFNQTTQRHIVTIEKPVEYLFQDNQCVIEQREVGVDVPSTEAALESAFHEDVDIVLATSVITPAAWKSVIALANTGKLVFVSVHANTIVSVLQSIVHDADPAEQTQLRMELATALGGVINQRIVTTITSELMPVVELLIPNDAVRTIIQSGDFMQVQNIISTSREEGMRSLDFSLRMAIDGGRITRQEAARHAENPRLFM
ncbi:MAG: ATPase, T2SS/T4P/T4SS family [Candidatus Kerfeldbacteria bacterium]|nr:ATPase, T2SS/T4P/T4SS family [Candidatus Kerfeldbacteria bacterium]